MIDSFNAVIICETRCEAEGFQLVEGLGQYMKSPSRGSELGRYINEVPESIVSRRASDS